MRYWLVKSEPDTYSIDDLKRDGVIAWEGVRNYQARNHMRDMKKGDLVLFYHSSTDPRCVAGIASVAREAHPDASQFDKKSPYFEPRASRESPVWECVDIAYVETARRNVTLDELKSDPKLDGLLLTQRGSRLSVQPVREAHFTRIRALCAE